MKLVVPTQRCYIKSEEYYYYDEDTISLISPATFSSVLIKIRQNGYGDMDTKVSLLDKEKRKSIVTITAKEFIHMIRGHKADFEVLNNDVFVMDHNNNKIQYGDIITIGGTKYTFNEIVMDDDKYLDDRNGAGISVIDKCTITVETGSGIMMKCQYKMVLSEGVSVDDAYVVYDLLEGPYMKLYKV